MNITAIIVILVIVALLGGFGGSHFGWYNPQYRAYGYGGGGGLLLLCLVLWLFFRGG